MIWYNVWQVCSCYLSFILILEICKVLVTLLFLLIYSYFRYQPRNKHIRILHSAGWICANKYCICKAMPIWYDDCLSLCCWSNMYFTFSFKRSLWTNFRTRYACNIYIQFSIYMCILLTTTKCYFISHTLFLLLFFRCILL